MRNTFNLFNIFNVYVFVLVQFMFSWLCTPAHWTWNERINEFQVQTVPFPWPKLFPPENILLYACEKWQHVQKVSLQSECYTLKKKGYLVLRVLWFSSLWNKHYKFQVKAPRQKNILLDKEPLNFFHGITEFISEPFFVYFLKDLLLNINKNCECLGKSFLSGNTIKLYSYVFLVRFTLRLLCTLRRLMSQRDGFDLLFVLRKERGCDLGKCSMISSQVIKQASARARAKNQTDIPASQKRTEGGKFHLFSLWADFGK